MTEGRPAGWKVGYTWQRDSPAHRSLCQHCHTAATPGAASFTGWYPSTCHSPHLSILPPWPRACIFRGHLLDHLRHLPGTVNTQRWEPWLWFSLPGLCPIPLDVSGSFLWPPVYVGYLFFWVPNSPQAPIALALRRSVVRGMKSTEAGPWV